MFHDTATRVYRIDVWPPYCIAGHANMNLGERVKPVLEHYKRPAPVDFIASAMGVTWDPHPEVQSRDTKRKLADEN